MQLAKRLFILFIVNLLVITTISIVLGILGVTMGLGANGYDYQTLAIYCLVWGMGGAFISLMLSRIMAKWLMGVEVIDPDTTDPQLSALVATVHKLATAANLPKMPEVGIFNSGEPNAFATGPTRSRALVAVSAGLLQTMNPSQVEAVLAHEITHVANGDMVTMTLLQGVINAIVMFLARVISFFISLNVKESVRPLVRILVTIVLQICLSILGSMVVMWFSRKREYAADAGGASLAGRENMISALEALQRTIQYQDPRQPESMATLKISGKPRGGFMLLFASHPPLEDRIAALQNMQM
jgi:heat shock protein HtpX